MQQETDRFQNIAAIFGSGCAVAVITAAPAFAAQSYRCSFVQECIADHPCETRNDLSVTLKQDQDNWVMTTGDGETSRFTNLTGAPTGTIRLISTDLDPDAAAAAMLSVSETGQAFLSTHGHFPSLGVVTHLGTCLSEDG